MERIKSESGQQVLGKNKMMWQGAYYEYAQSAKGGFLTAEEYQGNWLRWSNNPKHPRDWDGPRGYVQLLIPKTGKSVIDYNSVGTERSIDSHQKLAKGISEEQLLGKIKQLASGHDIEGISLLAGRMLASLGGVHSTSASSGNGDGNESTAGAFSGVGLAAPAMQELLQQGGAVGGVAQEDEQEEEEEEEKGADGKGGKEKYGTKILRATRPHDLSWVPLVA